MAPKKPANASTGAKKPGKAQSKRGKNAAAKAPEPLPIPETLTQAQFARLCNLSTRVVQDLAGRGILVYSGRNLRMPDSLHRYLDNLRKSAQGRQGTDGSDLISEKAKLTRMQAETAEITLKKARGELLDMHEVAEGWSRITSVVKSSVLGIPSRARAELPHLNAHDGQILDRVCRDTLEMAADELLGAPVAGATGPADLQSGEKSP
jgi:phage terminase Nu1 subunit (DNA packaging protein)